MTKIVLSFCNQPIFRVGRRYYTAHANFIDFLCHWTLIDSRSRVMVPVLQANTVNRHWVELSVAPLQVIEGIGYRSHVGAILSGLVNAIQFRWHVYKFNKTYRDEFRVVLPGANAFSATFSFLIGTRTASKSMPVVRGNSLKTISHMYSTSRIQWGVVLLSSFFVSRLKTMQKKGAIALCFGHDLANLYSVSGKTLPISPLIKSTSVSTKQSRETKSPVLTMLYIGRLSNEKGVMELLDAIECLIDSGYEFQFHIAGHGPLRDEVTKRVSVNKLQPYTNFLGRLSPGEEVLKTIDKADLFLLPSKTEGVPRVIVESLSRGVPVLTTPVGGIKSAFGDSVFYFESASVKHLFKGIRAMLESGIPQKNKATNTEALEQFTFSDNIRRIEQATCSC